MSNKYKLNLKVEYGMFPEKLKNFSVINIK